MDGALEPAPVLDEIIRLAERAGAPVRMTPKIDQLSRTDAAQGVIARGDPLPLAVDDELLADPRAFLLALDGVTDPRNLGAIFRTAEGAGATGVLLPRRRSVHVTPAVTKAAAGAVEHLPIALVSGIPAALERARRAGVWAVGLDERGSGDLFSLELATEPVVLVLGAEGRGLSRLARERCDVLVRIPMLGRALFTERGNRRWPGRLRGGPPAARIGHAGCLVTVTSHPAGARRRGWGIRRRMSRKCPNLWTTNRSDQQVS